jgi:hypothetical protein
VYKTTLALMEFSGKAGKSGAQPKRCLSLCGAQRALCMVAFTPLLRAIFADIAFTRTSPFFR